MANMEVPSLATPSDLAPADARTSNIQEPSAFWLKGLRWSALGIATALCLASASRSDGPTMAMMAAIILASALSSIAGFAFSAICGAMLFHLADDPVQIVQVMIVCSIANQAAMVWAIRRSVQWRRLGVFLAGGVIGLPIGVSALLYLDRHLYTEVLGVFLLVYGGYMLVRRPIVLHRQPVALDVLAGLFGGITGGAVGFPGATVTIWCGFKGWSKDGQRAVFQPFILVMQVAALLTISLVRRSGHSVGFNPLDLLCVFPGLLGTALGMACYRRLSDSHFALAVNILLVVSGASYVL